MATLALVVGNQTAIKGRDNKRKRACKEAGLQLVVNEPMGFLFFDARRQAAKRKQEQANMTKSKNARLRRELKKGK
jgi:hypothetical protein